MLLSKLHSDVLARTRSGTLLISQSATPACLSAFPHQLHAPTSSSHPKLVHTSARPIVPPKPPTWQAGNPGTYLKLYEPQSCPLNAEHQRRFSQHVLIDTTPMPDHIPKVPEIGASSAPLMSASFFIGARCKAYNDDFMKCKTDANGRGEIECLKEGRKVTRCAASV